MIQAKKEGYTPGMYVRAWHRQNTGQLRSIGKPWQHVRLQRTDELSLDDMPTMPIPVISKATKKLLALDGQGRPYLKRADKDRLLLDLCDELIREYRYFSGEYPAELVLSAFRYLTLDPISKRYGGYCTADGKTYIPYTYDASIRFPDYCIMARGIAKDTWIR
jgi:alpha-L-fucosidase